MLSDTECRHPPTHSEANTNTHMHTQKHALLMWHILFWSSPAPIHLRRTKWVPFIWSRACTASVCLSLIITKCKPANSSELLCCDTWLLIHAFIICNSTEQQKSITSNYWENTIVSAALWILSFCIYLKEGFFLRFFFFFQWPPQMLQSR